MKKQTLFFSALLFISVVAAQSNTGTQPAKTIQPKIMVIPRIADGQDMKAVYESNMNMQIAIAKINEAFEKNGANLVSFDQKYKQANQNIMINKSSGNQEDFKSTILQNAGADIYVEAKLDVVKHTARNANSVTVILEGYQTGTANLLGTKAASSRMNQTEDIGALVMQAMDSITISFLNLMQLKFNDIYENGQSVYVEFSLGPDATIDFDAEVGSKGKLLSEAIDEWFQEHAYKGVFNNQGVTSNELIISDVRIPLRNPSNPQANYTGQNLYTDILKFMRTLNVKVKREIGTNNKILITIQ